MKPVLKFLLGDAKSPHQSLAFDIGALVLRVAMGGMMAFGHGLGKFQNFLQQIGSPDGVQFPDPLGIGVLPSALGAVSAEFFCSLLLIVGLGTRFAAAPLVFTMMVAAFVVHADGPLFLPGQGAKEPALLYAVAFLGILLIGPGRLSLDHLIGRKL